MADRPIELPTAATLQRLRDIADTHADPDVRLLAGVVLRLGPAIEAIAGKLPSTTVVT